MCILSMLSVGAINILSSSSETLSGSVTAKANFALLSLIRPFLAGIFLLVGVLISAFLIASFRKDFRSGLLKAFVGIFLSVGSPVAFFQSSLLQKMPSAPQFGKNLSDAISQSNPNRLAETVSDLMRTEIKELEKFGVVIEGEDAELCMTEAQKTAKEGGIPGAPAPDGGPQKDPEGFLCSWAFRYLGAQLTNLNGLPRRSEDTCFYKVAYALDQVGTTCISTPANPYGYMKGVGAGIFGSAVCNSPPMQKIFKICPVILEKSIQARNEEKSQRKQKLSLISETFARFGLEPDVSSVASLRDGSLLLLGNTDQPFISGGQELGPLVKVLSEKVDFGFTQKAKEAILAQTGLKRAQNSVANYNLVKFVGELYTGSFVISVGAAQFVFALKADGTLDTGFKGIKDGYIQHLKVAPNGKSIYLTRAPQASAPTVERLNTDGSVDKTFAFVSSGFAAIQLHVFGNGSVLFLGERGGASLILLLDSIGTVISTQSTKAYLPWAEVHPMGSETVKLVFPSNTGKPETLFYKSDGQVKAPTGTEGR